MATKVQGLKQLNAWLDTVLKDPALPLPSWMGTWRQGGCYLFALAIYDALRAHDLAPQLIEHALMSGYHVAVAIGLLRLDVYGAWLIGVPPRDLRWTKKTEKIMNQSDRRAWPDLEIPFRLKVTERLTETFPGHAVVMQLAGVDPVPL